MFSRKPGPRAAFIEEVVAALRAVNPAVPQITENEADFSIAFSLNGQQQRCYLGTLFEECRECAPAERRARVERFVRAIVFETTEEIDWDQARGRLCVVARSGSMPMPVCGFDILPCVRELLVVDSVGSMRYVTGEQLKRWDVTVDQARTAAHEKLASVAGRGVEVYDEQPSRIFVVESDDSYEASRLLLPGFLASFEGKVDGRPIAVIPERSTLLIAGDAKPETVLRLCELASREFAASPRRISPALYGVGPGGRVVEYVRPINDAATDAVAQARLAFHGALYAEQRKRLQEEFQKTGVDVFVATYAGMANPTRSLTTWGWRVESLLPPADVVAVALEPGKGAFALVPWSTLMSIAPDRVTAEPDLYPPRWRTRGSLNAAQVEALRAASLR
jgi:hypothetical protein